MPYHLPNHQDIETDVFIAGSGPIGATFAKKFVDSGLRVVMVELGAADSFTFKPRVTPHGSKGDDETFSAQFEPNQVVVPGYHNKNEIAFQKDIDRFVNVIEGALSTVSVPTSNDNVPTLDPNSFSNSSDKPFLSLAKNPAQDPFVNLGAEAVTRGVGGMSTHWTCSTPRLNPYQELPKLVENDTENQKIWAKLYDEAENLIGTSSDEFDKSMRHNLVLRNLRKIYEDLEPDRVFKPLALACHRLTDPRYVEWHAADRILETLFTDPKKAKLFRLLTNHRCTKVNMRKGDKAKGEDEYVVDAATVSCLLPQSEGRSETEPDFFVKAQVYIIACGGVGTAQVLANSQRVPGPFPDDNRHPTKKVIETPLTPNLGKYITEQPLAFCQVVLNRDIINSVDRNPFDLPWWMPEVEKHREDYPQDPIHIPFQDPEPQVTSPFTKKHPWHTQIHRDAFSYGGVAENIDTRLIVDFRFFGYADPVESNTLKFQECYEDAFGLPQPTFNFVLSEDDRRRSRAMMADMCEMALKIGGYLPGSEPQFMTPGLSLHLAGTVRAGLRRDDTVADTNCKVWGFSNLYVGGNGVIPTGFAANPTLTSIAFAIRAADSIIFKIKSRGPHH